MAGSYLICSRGIKALFDAQLLELFEREFLFRGKMAEVTLESGLGFGRFGRRRASLFLGNVVVSHFLHGGEVDVSIYSWRKHLDGCLWPACSGAA